jgi:hypothetical protein
MNQGASLPERIVQYVAEKGTANDIGTQYDLKGSLADGRSFSILFRPGAGIGNKQEIGNGRMLEIHVTPVKQDQIGYAIGECGTVEEGIEKGFLGELYSFSVINFPNDYGLVSRSNSGAPYGKFVEKKREETLELVLNELTTEGN